MKKNLFLSALLLFVILFSLTAQVPQAMKYQAVVRNSGSVIVANTPVGVRLSILQGSDTGSVLYTETHLPSTNQFGLMTVTVGQGTPVTGTFSAINWADSAKYLQVEIDINNTGNGYTNMGVTQLISVPYAFYAARAGTTDIHDTVVIYTHDTVVINGGGGGTGWDLTGNTGTSPGSNYIGTSDSKDLVLKTNAVERMRITAAGGVSVNNPAPISTDKFSSFSTNAQTAISAYAYGNGVGLFAYTADTLDNSGDAIQVQNNGTGGRGINVYMNKTTNPDIGIVVSQAGTGRVANFQSNNLLSTSPTIFASHVGNARVLNLTNLSSTNTQPVAYIYQSSTAVSQQATAVWAQSSSTTAGRFMASAANDNTQVLYAEATGSGNYDAVAIYGVSQPAVGYGYGVIGTGNNFGLYSTTNSGAAGTKAFMIDHPLDPEHKFLKHYSIESPEVLNVYRGNAVLDANGEAVVQLPDYFQSVNKNFSYVLTPIGAPAQMYIKQKVNADGKFVIAGGTTGMEVSWYLYAERNDLYIQSNSNSREVEPVKRNNQVGKYLHPELYNQPKEKGMFYGVKESKTMETLPAVNSTSTTVVTPVNGTEQLKGVEK